MSTSRFRSVTPHESRPPRFDSPNIKRPSLLQRLNSRRRASFGDLSLQPATTAVVSATAVDSPPPSPFSSLRTVASKSLRGSSRRLLRLSNPITNHNSGKVHDPMNPNVMIWLQSSCPQDVLPKILAYTGPQMTAALNKTNRFWHDIISKDSTWRTLCEELYKVSYFVCVL